MVDDSKNSRRISIATQSNIKSSKNVIGHTLHIHLFMFFPSEYFNNWGHITPTAGSLVMSNTFFVSPGYHLLALSHWSRSPHTPAPIGPF